MKKLSELAEELAVRTDDGSVSGYARWEYPRPYDHQRWDGDEEPISYEITMKEDN